ncbi:MAG: hypothetical protein F6K36_19730 [Symploca sp. SIO3C6]|nr:hypothetical protein [Symploca sp. SIO3C6]
MSSPKKLLKPAQQGTLVPVSKKFLNPSLQKLSAPPSFRYFKARLKPLGQPSFWLSVAGLALLMLFGWKVWENPEEFKAARASIISYLKNPTADPQLSSEELAARLIDIDNSSVLIEELDAENALPPGTLPNQESETTNLPNSPNATNSSDLEKLSSPRFTLDQLKAGNTQKSTKASRKKANKRQQDETEKSILSVRELFNQSTQPENSSLTNLNTTNQSSSPLTLGATSNSALGLNSLNSLNSNQSTVPATPLPSSFRQFRATNSPLNTSSVQIRNNNPLKTNTGTNKVTPETNFPRTSQTTNNSGNQTLKTSLTPGNLQPKTNYLPKNIGGAVDYNLSPQTPTVSGNSFSNSAPSQLPVAASGTLPVTPTAQTGVSTFGRQFIQPSAQSNTNVNPTVQPKLGNFGLQSSQGNPAFGSKLGNLGRVNTP